MALIVLELVLKEFIFGRYKLNIFILYNSFVFSNLENIEALKLENITNIEIEVQCV